MKEKYPIGKFQHSGEINKAIIDSWIYDIECLPLELSTLCKTISQKALDTPYRDGGWTARQVIHHLADSHINSYLRFKWSLAEDEPTIKAYDEKTWAEQKEAKEADIQISLDIIKAMHGRWVHVLRNMNKSDFERGFIHPESQSRWQLDKTTGLYAWHGKHHIAHIEMSIAKSTAV